MIRTLVRYDITICGIDELPLHREAGVSDVLSIIDPQEIDPEAFITIDPISQAIGGYMPIPAPATSVRK